MLTEVLPLGAIGAIGSSGRALAAAVARCAPSFPVASSAQASLLNTNSTYPHSKHMHLHSTCIYIAHEQVELNVAHESTKHETIKPCIYVRRPSCQYIYIYTPLRVSSWGCPNTLRPGAPRWGLSAFLMCLDGDSVCAYLV